MKPYTAELFAAIKHNHGCEAERIGSVPVKEVFRGETAWEGLVEVFALKRHPKAKKCYAWGYLNDAGNGWEITTVLEIPPVDSPEMAVKVAIAAKVRQGITK